MHAPSLVQLLATGLVAATAVAGFHGPSTSSLAVRYAGALIVAAGIPAVVAAPTTVEGIEARTPEAKKGKKKGKGKGKKKKTKARDLTFESSEFDERDVEELVTREPEPAKKKKGKKGKGKGKKKTKARDLTFTEDAELESRDFEDLETRAPEPEAKKKKGKGKGKKGKGKKRSVPFGDDLN